jgi:WD40 repeat protein
MQAKKAATTLVLMALATLVASCQARIEGTPTGTASVDTPSPSATATPSPSPTLTTRPTATPPRPTPTAIPLQGTISEINWSPGRYIEVTTERGFYFLDPETLTVATYVAGEGSFLGFSPDGRLFALRYDYGVRVGRTRNGELLYDFSGARGFAFSSDGLTAASLIPESGGVRVRVMDRMIEGLVLRRTVFVASSAAFEPAWFEPYSAALSPDGGTLAFDLFEGTERQESNWICRFVRTADGSVIRSLDHCIGLEFAGDWSYLAAQRVATWTSYVYQVSDATVMGLVPIGSVTGLRLHIAEGRVLSTDCLGSPLGGIRVQEFPGSWEWGVFSPSCIGSGIRPFAFSPDGAYLAAVVMENPVPVEYPPYYAGENAVAVWRLSDGALMGTAAAQ